MRTEHWKCFPWLSRTFYVRVSWLSRITYVHFHVFPRLLNRVDIKQVRFSYNTEYVTQFTIIPNDRSNRVWQWTMIMFVKAENMYTGQKCSNHLVYFHNFPGSRPNFMTFQAWKILILNSMTFQDLYAPCIMIQTRWMQSISTGSRPVDGINILHAILSQLRSVPDCIAAAAAAAVSLIWHVSQTVSQSLAVAYSRFQIFIELLSSHSVIGAQRLRLHHVVRELRVL